MIGGIVLETRIIGTKCRLWVIDTDYYSDELAVFVPATGDLPEAGDMIWWQADNVYWTAADRSFEDRPLQKIGYSFDPRISG